jgi:hypothetical protein
MSYQLDSHTTAAYQRLSTYVTARSYRNLRKLPITKLLNKESGYMKAWSMQASTALNATRQSYWSARQLQYIMLLGMRRLMAGWLVHGHQSRSV